MQETLEKLNAWKEKIDESFGALQLSYDTIVKDYLEWKKQLENLSDVEIEELDQEEEEEEKPVTKKSKEKPAAEEKAKATTKKPSTEEKAKATTKKPSTEEKAKATTKKPSTEEKEKTKATTKKTTSKDDVEEDEEDDDDAEEEKPKKKVAPTKEKTKAAVKEKEDPKKVALLERILKKNTEDGYYNISTMNKLKKTEASIKRGIQYYTFKVNKKTVRIAAPTDKKKELKETFKILGVDPVLPEGSKEETKSESTKKVPTKKTEVPKKVEKASESSDSSESEESKSSSKEGIVIEAGDEKVELYWDGDLLLDENTFVFNPKNKMLVGIQDPDDKTKVKRLDDLEYQTAKDLNYKISPIALPKKA